MLNVRESEKLPPSHTEVDTATISVQEGVTSDLHGPLLILLPRVWAYRAMMAAWDLSKGPPDPQSAPRCKDARWGPNGAAPSTRARGA